MSAHTPGPWTYHRARMPSDGEYDYAIRAEINGRGYCIAECFGRVATDVRPNAEANARLIAAAPDYHAEALALINRHDAKARDANFERCGCDDCKPLRAIAAKAEGAP